MKKIILFALTAFYSVCISAQQNPDKLAIEFNKLLSAEYKAAGPGATVIVASHGKVIYKKAFGMANIELNIPMRTDHVFRIGSLTKQFTAIAILQLTEQGKLHLQDEITKYIPDYPMQGSKITIEHLLTHTSGIMNYTSMKDYGARMTIDMTPTEMIAYFRNQPMRFAPGTRWEYSNSNYFLLGYIIEVITGNSYASYLEDHFFKPLGMTSSLYASNSKIVKSRADGYTMSNTGLENAAPLSLTQPFAAGSILSSVDDLFKWNEAVHSAKLVKKETLEKAFTRYRLADGKETNYGYGWRTGFIQENPMVWHGGLINGFSSAALYIAKDDLFVAVLTNCDGTPPVDLSAKLAAVAIGKPYTYTAIRIDSMMLAAYVGVYENERGQQRVLTVSGNKLQTQAGRGKKATIIAYQKDRFFFEEDKFQSADFTRNADGHISALTMKNRAGSEVWTKTNKSAPPEDGVQLDEKKLETYTGVYELSSNFSFTVTHEQGKLFLQAKGQEKVQLFAESEGLFFLKVNDAQLQFVADGTGKIVKAILNQGGRMTDAIKTK
jgi:CubicO group peptidase (beta-lactamase class C family)